MTGEPVHSPGGGSPAKQSGLATQATRVRRSYRREAGAIPLVVRDTPHGWAAPKAAAESRNHVPLPMDTRGDTLSSGTPGPAGRDTAFTSTGGSGLRGTCPREVGGTGCPPGKTFFLHCQGRHPELPQIPTYLPPSALAPGWGWQAAAPPLLPLLPAAPPGAASPSPAQPPLPPPRPFSRRATSPPHPWRGWPLSGSGRTRCAPWATASSSSRTMRSRAATSLSLSASLAASPLIRLHALSCISLSCSGGIPGCLNGTSGGQPSGPPPSPCRPPSCSALSTLLPSPKFRSRPLQLLHCLRLPSLPPAWPLRPPLP